jgi:hypothetical protein
VTMTDVHSAYQHTVRSRQPPSVRSYYCVTLLVEHDAQHLTPAIFTTHTCSFPSLVPVMT